MDPLWERSVRLSSPTTRPREKRRLTGNCHPGDNNLDELPEEDIERLIDAIDDLAKNPRPPGSKKLAAREGYRIRKGQYRVLHTVDDTAGVVIVYQVGNRRDVYRRR